MRWYKILGLLASDIIRPGSNKSKMFPRPKQRTTDLPPRTNYIGRRSRSTTYFAPKANGEYSMPQGSLTEDIGRAVGCWYEFGNTYTARLPFTLEAVEVNMGVACIHQLLSASTVRPPISDEKHLKTIRSVLCRAKYAARGQQTSRCSM